MVGDGKLPIRANVVIPLIFVSHPYSVGAVGICGCPRSDAYTFDADRSHLRPHLHTDSVYNKMGVTASSRVLYQVTPRFVGRVSPILKTLFKNLIREKKSKMKKNKNRKTFSVRKFEVDFYKIFVKPTLTSRKPAPQAGFV